MRVRFGSFEFDTATRELRRDGARVHLSPKSFDLLQILVERRPALVTKSELQDRLWPDAVVLEANLGNAVAEIRKALGDDPKSPAFVCTVSRRGYRFAADVQVVSGIEPSPGAVKPRWWLVWKDTILPLAEGENVVGRSPNSAIWIDAASVSREHARVLVANGRAMVEDRRSTNGTFVNGERIASPHVLADGNTLRFGSEETVFREWSETAAPATEPVRPPARPASRSYRA
jgi:DNA-binding winged helix-turn-helix (wHTH) protein